MTGIIALFTGGIRFFKEAEIMNASMSQLVTLVQSYKSNAAYWSPLVTHIGGTAAVASSACLIAILGKQFKIANNSEKANRRWNYLVMGTALFAAFTGLFWKHASICLNDAKYLHSKCAERLIQELCFSYSVK